MPKYLVRGNYVGDGVQALIQEGGTARHEVAKAAAESVGGTLECLYFAFGDTDIYAICDFPDAASATALSLLINASGTVSVNLTPLLTPADVDASQEKHPEYRAPGS